MTIADIVRDTRGRLGVSLRKFAVMTGVSYGLVWFWERSTTTPSYEAMYYLYSHTDNAEIKAMASRIMQMLDTGRWKFDTANEMLPLCAKTAPVEQ